MNSATPDKRSHCPVVEREARHTRKAPPAWQELVAHVDTISPRNKIGLVAVYDHALRLPLEDFEDARYFGLGQVICKMAKHLGATERIVKAGANALAKDHERLCNNYVLNPRKGLYGLELYGSTIGAGVFGPAQKGMEQLPLGERAIIEALSHISDTNPNTSRHTRRVNDKTAVRTMLRGEHTAHTLQKTMFAATSSLMILELKARAEACGATNYCAPGRAPGYLIREAMPPDELRNLDILQVATLAAKLRFDEFSNLQNYLIRKSGAFHFLRQLVPKVPHENHEVKHQARIACPAVSVPGSIATALALEKEIIIAADERITRKPFWQTVIGKVPWHTTNEQSCP